MSLSLESLEAATFEPLLQMPFVLRQSEEEKFSLILSEVKRLGHRRDGAVRDPFSLTFQGEVGWRLPQAIYSVEHEATGPLAIFLTQIGAGESGSLFEAIFT